MEERHLYLLAYDIADPHRLARIAKAMEAIGERVQDSVFEAYLSQAELEKLLNKVGKLMDFQKDSLRIYFVCASCRAKVQILGPGRLTSPPSSVIL